MPAEEYCGPERRARSAREIDYDRRLIEVEERLKHVEEVLVSEADPESGLVEIVHSIRHGLGNNTMVTTQTKKRVDDIAKGTESLLAMMSTFTALNQLAHAVELLIKRVLPVVTAAAALWGAFKAWGPK